MQRLNVNINDETAHDIKTLMGRKSMTATEIVRRAVSVTKFLEDAQRRGERIEVVEERDGETYIARVHIVD